MFCQYVSFVFTLRKQLVSLSFFVSSFIFSRNSCFYKKIESLMGVYEGKARSRERGGEKMSFASLSEKRAVLRRSSLRYANMIFHLVSKQPYFLYPLF